MRSSGLFPGHASPTPPPRRKHSLPAANLPETHEQDFKDSSGLVSREKARASKLKEGKVTETGVKAENQQPQSHNNRGNEATAFNLHMLQRDIGSGLSGSGPLMHHIRSAIGSNRLRLGR